MRRMSHTAVSEVAEQLAAAFGLQFGVEIDAYVRTFDRVLADLDEDDVRAVVNDWCARQEKRPAPANIRDLALHRAHQRRAAEGAGRGPDSRCPVCRRNPFVAGFELPSGEVIGRVRCECRQSSARWATDRARRFIDPDLPAPRGYDPRQIDGVPESPSDGRELAA